MREMLEEKLARFEELEQQMTDPEVLSNSQKMARIAREHGALAKLATRYRSFKQVAEEISEVSVMADSDDPEERELAEMELPELKAKRETVWSELLDLTIGGEDATRKRCVMEIRAGTGGDEAALFCRAATRPPSFAGRQARVPHGEQSARLLQPRLSPLMTQIRNFGTQMCSQAPRGL